MWKKILERLYKNGKISKERLAAAKDAGLISEEEYAEIAGDEA